jgi:chromosomal replication initiator protein
MQVAPGRCRAGEFDLFKEGERYMSMSFSTGNGSEELGQIWTGVLSVINTLVNNQAYHTWFEPMRPVSMENNTVTIDCPSKFFADFVSEHHRDNVAYAFRQVAEIDPRVDFVCTVDSQDELIGRKRATPVLRTTPNRQPQRRTFPGAGERLNSKYQFKEFVVGNNSRMTFAACLAVSEQPAKVYNPLFIYGGVGLGKTHLMQAIGHAALNSDNSPSVHYSSAEEFMNEMITAIREGKSHEFRAKYRTVDLLLIDDVQFLAGKESTQEEFFHTFNALYGADKQIVLTSDRPPKEIPTLEERLVSRFEWGLVTDIQLPDYETRLAILRKKVERDNVGISDDVLALIADRVRSNIRELEGSLIRLIVHASVNDQDITLDVAKEVLQDFVKTRARKIKISTIQKVVAQHYGVPADSMKSKVRTARLAFPRQVAIYLSRELTDCSLTQIGQRFGRRDHTTIIHAYQKISEQMERDVSLKATINQLTKELTQ